MGFASDLKIIYHLALKPVRGKDHAARMESFYSGQAEAYDDFRKRLLKGRQELWNLLHPPEGGTWIDMGGGTGGNLEYFADVGWDKAAAAAGPPSLAGSGGPALASQAGPTLQTRLGGLGKIYVLDL